MNYFKAFLTGCLIFLIGSVSAQQSEKRIALVIGNCEYEYSGKLRLVEEDADIISSELTKYGFDLIKGINCKRETLTMLTDSFLMRLNSFDICLIYYAGHAVHYNGRSYLVPTDIDTIYKEMIETKLISFDNFISNIKEAGLKKNFIFTDTWRPSRFSNQFIQEGIYDMQAPENFSMVWSAVPTSAGESYSIPGLFVESLIKYMAKSDLKHIDIIKLVRKRIWELSKKTQIVYFKENNIDPFYFNQK